MAGRSPCSLFLPPSSSLLPTDLFHHPPSHASSYHYALNLEDEEQREHSLPSSEFHLTLDHCSPPIIRDRKQQCITHSIPFSISSCISSQTPTAIKRWFDTNKGRTLAQQTKTNSGSASAPAGQIPFRPSSGIQSAPSTTTTTKGRNRQRE